MKSPHWDLELVKSVAAQREGLFIKRTRALDYFATRKVAYEKAREIIANLTVGSFSKSEQQQFGEWCDTYGIQIDGAGWLLKFTIDESMPQVVVISLHPLEKGPLKTNKGMVTP